MPTEKFSIATPAGHTLSGALEMPSGLVRGAALFAHCFTCTMQSKAAVEVTRALAREGIACLRFDFTGLGASEGEFGRAGFGSDVADLMAAAKELCERFGDGILLVGHSLGGAAVLAAASLMGPDKVAAVATIGAPSDVPHVLHNIKGDIAAIERDGQGDVTIGGRAFRLSKDFLDNTREVDLLESLGTLRIPLMICHSPTDQIVGIEHAGTLFGAAKHPKSFVSLAGADHMLTNAADARFAAAIIANWAHRYLPLQEDLPAPDEGVIVRTGYGRFGTQIVTASHDFVADEPIGDGGDDSGPNPYDLLLGALGACTAMTMKMYADRKAWPFEGTRIHLTHERDHAEDCGHVLEEGAQVQAIHRCIELLGESLDRDQREKLMEIANKCPVHRTLTGHLHVHTEAVQ